MRRGPVADQNDAELREIGRRQHDAEPRHAERAFAAMPAIPCGGRNRQNPRLGGTRSAANSANKRVECVADPGDVSATLSTSAALRRVPSKSPATNRA